MIDRCKNILIFFPPHWFNNNIFNICQFNLWQDLDVTSYGMYPWNFYLKFEVHV